jgi:DNA-binding NarL/FixJ family response regulator
MMRVVVIDDSAVVRERLVSMFSKFEGVVVVGEGKDAQEGTRIVRETDPDLVVLDIRMPRGSGIDVLRNIKKNHPSVKVIVLTDYPFDQYRRKCRELGADFFFEKSNGLTEVKEAVNQLLKDEGRR